MSPHADSLITRDGTEAGAAACAAIYEPYVLDSPVTCETEPPDAEEMAERIAEQARPTRGLCSRTAAASAATHTEGPFRTRAAYRWSCEVSVYLEVGRRRTGAGLQLYTALFERLTARGFRTAVAGMTLPNEESVGLHRAMGFEAVGTFRDVGYKFDAWHDVFWAQRPLAATEGPPAELIPSTRS